MERRRTLNASGIVIKHDKTQSQQMPPIEQQKQYNMKNEFKKFERRLTKLVIEFSPESLTQALPASEV